MAIKIGNHNNVLEIKVSGDDVKAVTKSGTGVLWSKPITLELQTTYGKVSGTPQQNLIISEPSASETSTGARGSFSNATSGSIQAYYGDNINFSYTDEGDPNYDYTLSEFKWYYYKDNTYLNYQFNLALVPNTQIFNPPNHNIDFNKMLIKLIYTKTVKYHWATIYNNPSGYGLNPTYSGSAYQSFVETTKSVSLADLYGQSVPTHTKIRITADIRLWTLPYTEDSCTDKENDGTGSILEVNATASPDKIYSGSLVYRTNNDSLTCSNYASSISGFVSQQRVSCSIYKVEIWTPVV